MVPAKAKKVIKVILIILLAAVLIVGGYVAYVMIDYHRIEDNQVLQINDATSDAALVDTEYKVISYNIGFAAYTPEFGFFMDGGTESWAWSQERLTDNIGNIGSFLSQQHADFYLIQEVDRDSTRSYHVDEAALLAALESGKVRAAGLDVYADEPASNVALYSHPMVSCTPHIGAATVEAQKRIGQEIVEIIAAM